MDHFVHRSYSYVALLPISYHWQRSPYSNIHITDCKVQNFSLYQNYPNFIWNRKKNHSSYCGGVCFISLNCVLFILSEIEKFQGSDGKKEDEEKKYLDVISNKNIKLSERVLIPVKQYPKVLHAACCVLSVCLRKMINVLVFICLFLIKM